MTAVLTRRRGMRVANPPAPDGLATSGGMPGWNVVADLTPPELINLRWLGVLRRRIIAGLVAVVLLCGAGYVYAVTQSDNAASSSDFASAETTALQQAANKYSGITRIESTIDQIRGQVATVMQDDVDVPHIVALIRAALPNSMSIQNLTLTLTPAAPAGTSAGLDASGRPEIGLVTITGSGRTLDDLPTFVDRLAAVPGMVNVLPGSNQVSSGIAQFSLTASLTDQFYSHRYDAANTGVK